MEYSSLILKNGSFLRWIFPQEWHTRIWPDGSLMVCPDGADKCDASAMVFWLPCGIFFGMLIWDRVAGCIWKMLFFFGDFFRDCLRVCFFWRICVFQNLHGSSFSEFTNCLGWGFGLRKERSHLAVDLLRNFSVLFSADLVISFRGHPNHAHSLCEQTYCGIVLQKTTGEEEMREGSACKILPSMRFRNNTPIEF